MRKNKKIRRERSEESEVRGREKVERTLNRVKEKQCDGDEIYDTITCLIIHKTAITTFYKNISFK